MLIYGTRTAFIHRKSTNFSCPHCHSEGTISLHVFRKYAHLFWIPFFPLAKESVSECSHCKQVLNKKEMTQPFIRAAKEAQQYSRTPIWFFSGIFLLSCFILFVAWNSERLTNATTSYLENPQAGDVYELKLDTGYTLWKVTRVAGDTVFVRESLFFANRRSGLRKLKKQQNQTSYLEEETAKNKALLQEMFREGTLLYAERP